MRLDASGAIRTTQYAPSYSSGSTNDTNNDAAKLSHQIALQMPLGLTSTLSLRPWESPETGNYPNVANLHRQYKTTRVFTPDTLIVKASSTCHDSCSMRNQQI